MPITFPVGYIMKPSLLHVSLWAEEKSGKQDRQWPWQWLPDTTQGLQFITFYRVLFENQVSFPLSLTSDAQKFSFQLCLCINRIFWGGCFRVFTVWVGNGLRLYVWLTWRGNLMGMSFKNGFVCMLYIWRLCLYFLLDYSVFQHCHRRTKLTYIYIYLEGYIFPRKALFKEAVMVGPLSCMALCYPFAS